MYRGKQLLFITALKKIKTHGYFGHSVQYIKSQELTQSKLPFLELGMWPQTNPKFSFKQPCIGKKHSKSLWKLPLVSKAPRLRGQTELSTKNIFSATSESRVALPSFSKPTSCRAWGEVNLTSLQVHLPVTAASTPSNDPFHFPRIKFWSN